jgi:hypothetical protein
LVALKPIGIKKGVLFEVALPDADVPLHIGVLLGDAPQSGFHLGRDSSGLFSSPKGFYSISLRD